MRSRQPEIPNPISEETEGGKFKHELVIVRFRGQELPSHFTITYKGKREPKEGQIIGHTRFGQTLYYEQGSVIAKG